MHSDGVLSLDFPRYFDSRRGSLSLTHWPFQKDPETFAAEVVDVVVVDVVVVVVVVVVEAEVVVVVPIVLPVLLGGLGLGGGRQEKANWSTKKATIQRGRGIGLGSAAIL